MKPETERHEVDPAQDTERLWLERVAPFGEPSAIAGLLGAVGWASLLFLAGAAVATLAGFGDVFGSTAAAYLGPLGVALVAFAIHWGWHRIPRALDEVASCFNDDVEVRSFTRAALRKMASSRTPLAVGVLFGLAIFVGGAFVMFNPDSPVATVPARIYGAAWFAPEARIAKLAILALYALPVGLLVVTGGFLIAQNTKLIWELSHRPLRLVWPHLIPRLRALVAFYTVVGAAWSAGIILVIALYQTGLDALVLAFLVVTSALGLTIVLMPHVLIHDALLRAERELGDIIRTQSAKALELESDPAKRIAIYKAASEPLRVVSWPYEPSGYITLVLGQLLPALYALVTPMLLRL